MSNSSKNETIKGISWSAIDSISAQGITFIVSIVLGRLLSPAEYGTIGVANIFVALFNKIVDSGFSNALIRKQDTKNIDYNTTFIINLSVSGVLYVLCFLFAPLIARYFNNDILESVIRWICLVVIINAFAIIHRTQFIKNINFKTQAKISVFSSIISGVIGIAMAIAGCGVWSLVGQQISRQLCNTVLFWVYNKWRPQIEFSYQSFKELFSFGSKLLLTGITDTIFNELSTIVTGKIYRSATLGQYSRAKQFGSMFSSNLSTVMERVTYPVLSRFQNNQNKLIDYYKIMIRSLMLVSGIGLAIISSCARPIILILLGEKWTEAIIYLQLIAFVDVFIPLKNVNLNLLKVYGRSDYIFRLSIIKRIIELSAVLLGIYFSMEWMIIGFAITGFIGFVLNAYCTSKESGYKVWDQIADLIPSFSLSLLVGIAMFIVSVFIDNIYICLITQLFIGAILFFTIAEITKLKEYVFVKQIVVDLLKKMPFFNRNSVG